jgi:hypothetical protein
MGEGYDHYPQLIPADQYPRYEILGGLHFFVFHGKKRAGGSDIPIKL